MPEDFNKKYREWEQLKVSKPGDGANGARPETQIEKKVKKKRKSQERWVRNPGKKIKEDNQEVTGLEVGSYAWLDKELHKIDREKQRLEKEESRLLAMRQALGDQQKAKNEINVKIATGEEFKYIFHSFFNYYKKKIVAGMMV